jgi:transmembrane sensor
MPAPQHDTAETEALEREAVAWFVRMSADNVSAVERQAFRAWLAGGRDRHEAFNAIKGLWHGLDVPAAELGRGGWYRQRAPRRRPLARSFRMAAVAAGLASVLFGGALWRDGGFIDRAMADYATRPGEQRQVMLADGSSVLLDGDTAIRVAVADGKRDVDVLRGRVFLDVVHDPARPFRVVANAVEARVLGTAFAVEDDGSDVTVSVERGRVAVATGGERTELSVGQEVTASTGRLGRLRSVDPAMAQAWRRGLIVLDAAPLSRIVEELGRMQPGRFIIPDASLQKLTLSGVFSIHDPDAVIEALRTGLGLRTASVPGFATLIYR